MRTTPAGVPVRTFLLAHHSLQQEAGRPRQARLRIHVFAAGPLAQACAELRPQATVEVEGFLSRASYRREATHLALHAQRIHILADTEGQHED